MYLILLLLYTVFHPNITNKNSCLGAEKTKQKQKTTIGLPAKFRNGPSVPLSSLPLHNMFRDSQKDHITTRIQNFTNGELGAEGGGGGGAEGGRGPIRGRGLGGERGR